MQRMIKLLAIAGLLLSVATAHAVQVGVAAVVNGEKISEAKLTKAVDAKLKQQGSNVGAIRDPKKYKKLREKVLDILISQKLLWEKAKSSKLVASDAEVDKLYNQYQSQYPSKADFEKKMKLEGYDTKSYRTELKQQLSAKKWVQENVMRKLSVNTSEISKFYKDNADKFQAPEMIQARHILITLAKDAPNKDKKAARKQLNKIKKQLKQGADFAELARKHSKGPSGPKGGDLGFFRRGQMVKPFEDAAFKLKEGQVSDIVETRFGYHLIKLEKRQAAKVVSEKEVADRIHQYLLRQKSETALNDALAKLKKEAKIEKTMF